MLLSLGGSGKPNPPGFFFGRLRSPTLAAARYVKMKTEGPVPVSRACLLATALSVGIMLTGSSSGYAQQDVRAQGAKACGPDANRLCKHVLEQGDLTGLF